MTKQFEQDLDGLKQQLLKMAAKAETMIHLSMQALVQRDISLDAELAELEEDVNKLQLDVDDRCFKLLALRQPMAHDLRFIIAAGKISSDLERIGDLTINIHENTKVLLQFPELKPLIDIPKMADLSRQMVRDSLDAFVEEDAVKARKTVMWMNHHRLFNLINRSDDGLIALNTLLLLGVTWVPFPTALLAQHLLGSDQYIPAALYSGSYVIIAIMFNVLWRYVVKRKLVVDHANVSAITRQYYFGPLFYLIALLIGFKNATACLVFNFLLVLYFALPPRFWRRD